VTEAIALRLRLLRELSVLAAEPVRRVELT
jgi:hypothetical protein